MNVKGAVLSKTRDTVRCHRITIGRQQDDGLKRRKNERSKTPRHIPEITRNDFGGEGLQNAKTSR
jgi:hypothetical protein